MNHSHPSSLSANEVLRSLRIVSERVFSLLSLMLLLLTLGAAHAQNNPMDSPPLGRSDTGQYKSGQTPTGQPYGVIKEGEPHKNKATKKKALPNGRKTGYFARGQAQHHRA